MRRTDRQAFTIIELLVVIGVLGLLMGLLLPALGAAHRKGLKSMEMNAIKQIGIAWQLYSMNNKDQVLPGFLEPEVQQRWNVTYQFSDHGRVPPAPNYMSGDNIAGPWTWRLMTHLGHSHDMVHGYLDEPEFDPTKISTDLEEARRMAYEPGFGYNARYVGGWWSMYGNTPLNSDFDGDGEIGSDEEFSADLVVRSVASIKRSSELLIFCSSTLLEPGMYRNLPNGRMGAHYVVPPKTVKMDSNGDVTSGPPEQQWSVPSAAGGGADVTRVEVATKCAIPYGRYNRLAATLFADLHTEVNNLQALSDMRKWIPRASSFDFPD